jgi:protein TonB
MDLKKTYKVNLEKKKGFHLFLGLIITLSLILISFEWTSETTRLQDLNSGNEISVDEIIMPILRREEVKPLPKPELPPIAKVITPVDGDPEIDPVFWDSEYRPGDDIVFPIYPDDPGDDIIAPEDHIITEIMPTFNGGDPKIEFYKYLYGKLKYPAEAVANGVTGKVIVKFVVNYKGYIERAEILKGVHPILDEEALRVINSSPRWEPGFQSGHYVNVIYTFPITFVLHE